MRLDFATSDFMYGGLPRPGFPLLSDDDLEALEPFHSFLIEELLDEGRCLKQLTWDAYGRALWYFASYLRGHERDWRPDQGANGTNAAHAFRDWSRQTVGTSTTNDRTRVVGRFYRWALRTGRINRLPFRLSDLQAAHTTDSFEYRLVKPSNDGLKLREYQLPLAFLTKAQVATVRRVHLHPTHKLMFEMAARIGLRSSELRTFPVSYVIDPTKSSWLNSSGVIKVRLDPREMSLKFDKSRMVDVPYSLMCDMHKYKAAYRPGLLQDSEKHKTLLLTTWGRPFSKDAVVGAFRSISAAVGFHVRAHILRHTFAVYFLLALRQDPDYEGNPLEHLMSQLGHSSIQSVLTYLKHIGEASVAANNEIQRRLDDIFVD